MTDTTRSRKNGLVRRKLMLSLLLIATLGILGRALYLQLFHKDFLQNEGNIRYLRVLEIPAHRGMILDRNGEVLAVSSPVDSVWANPSEVLTHRARLPALAELLGMDSAVLEKRLSEREDREFIYVRRHLPPHLAQHVIGLGVPGINLQREYRRYYPTAEVTSHLLGFTNIDDVGQEGLERLFEQ